MMTLQKDTAAQYPIPAATRCLAIWSISPGIASVVEKLKQQVI